MRILVIEDDAKIAGFLQRGLEAEKHVVDVARSGPEGERRALGGGYDLVLLDLALPGLDGREVLKRLREGGDATPVIVVTAKSAVEDRVGVLDLGADDYLVKPFSFVELLARFRAIQRRRSAGVETVLRQGPYQLDTVKHVAMKGTTPIDLTTREYQLLEYFMRHRGETLTRAMLADRVWGIDFDPGSNVIDVYVKYLRKKLGSESSGGPIRTIRGVGYVFDPGPAPDIEGGPE